MKQGLCHFSHDRVEFTEAVLLLIVVVNLELSDRIACRLRPIFSNTGECLLNADKVSTYFLTYQTNLVSKMTGLFQNKSCQVFVSDSIMQLVSAADRHALGHIHELFQ